ncbi:uncharacterized protein LOC125004075 [Mugil cephalus]|uniref:uncharacterized protein LOC125004075 n=1 Tax=Mugil cephalus TaxID=48193 RepID=UPI001FB7346D|nr:uncharacterized protein LOC125004075 [Mugil cephalus]
MTTYITELAVSLNEAEESQLRKRNFQKIYVNLNQGAGENGIYLWYKTGSSGPITRIQFSFTSAMTKGLNDTGYTMIDKDLNAGTEGDNIYLWFYNGSSEYDVPIVSIDVTLTDDAQKFKSGWERSACDLKRDAGGKMIYLWVKREKPTYICDITATEGFGGDDEHFKNGFIRVDEDISRGAGGSYVFIWFRLTTDSQKAIRDLQISLNHDQYVNYQNHGYQMVNMDLNQGTGGNQEFLWYKKDPMCGNPVKDFTLIVGSGFIAPFKRAGVVVIDKSVNTGNRSYYDMYLCYYV